MTLLVHRHDATGKCARWVPPNPHRSIKGLCVVLKAKLRTNSHQRSRMKVTSDLSKQTRAVGQPSDA